MNRERFLGGMAVASFALAAAIAATTGWGHPQWWAVPALMLAVTAAQAAAVHLVVGRQRFAFALTDAFIAVGMVLAPGWWIAVSVAGGVVVSQRNLAPVKIGYNVSNLVLSVSLGVACSLAVGGGVGGAVLGLTVFALANHMMTTLAVSVSSREPYHQVLVSTAWLGILHNAGNFSVGLLAAWLSLHAPAGLLGLVVPLVLLWWSYEQQTRRAAEARLFEELARGQEKIAGKTVDVSAQIVVTAAARLFGGAEVEMLLRHPDGLIRYVGDEHGLRSRTRAEPNAFGAPWVLRVLANEGGLTGIGGLQPFWCAALGERDRPMAVLLARRPERAQAFTRAEEQLARVLVVQAESWLSVADLTARHDVAMGKVEVYGAASRVLGDIGAHTAPALSVLRESADRLSRLAYAFEGPDPVSEIVDELHAVERAVASLLGAISTASDPGQAGRADRGMGTSSMPRTEPEWTTTGQLDALLDR